MTVEGYLSHSQPNSVIYPYVIEDKIILIDWISVFAPALSEIIIVLFMSNDNNSLIFYFTLSFILKFFLL